MILTLIIFSTVAVCVASFMILNMLLLKKGIGAKKMALVGAMTALTVRVLKSVFFYSLYPQLSIWFVAFGFLGFSLIGPFAYYYFTQPNTATMIRFSVKDALHLLFPVVGFLLLLTYTVSASGLYFLCTLSMGTYLFMGYHRSIYLKNNAKSDEQKWEKVFFALLLAILVAFLIPFTLPMAHAYTLSTALAATLLYMISFFFLKFSPKLFKNGASNKIENEQRQRILKALEEDQVFKDPALTLHTFCDQINIPKYIIAEVIRNTYNKSFHGAINSLRIKCAQEHLKNGDEHLKIEALAYDVGFNTLSAFYAVFKKETHMSPREYQRSLTEIPG